MPPDPAAPVDKEVDVAVVAPHVVGAEVDRPVSGRADTATDVLRDQNERTLIVVQSAGAGETGDPTTDDDRFNPTPQSRPRLTCRRLALDPPVGDEPGDHAGEEDALETQGTKKEHTSASRERGTPLLVRETSLENRSHLKSYRFSPADETEGRETTVRLVQQF